MRTVRDMVACLALVVLLPVALVAGTFLAWVAADLLSNALEWLAQGRRPRGKV